MMNRPYRAIGDYATIGDCHSAALVSSDASIDWACFPRFDSPSVFARLLDARRGGSFQIRPIGRARRTRRYLPATNVLQTSFRTERGQLDIVDFMPIFGPGGERTANQIVRVVECTAGTVEVSLSFAPRFAYASVRPRFRDGSGDGVVALGRGEALTLESDVALHVGRERVTSRFALRAGERRHVILSYYPHEQPVPRPIDADAVDAVLAATVRYWQDWAAGCRYQGPYREYVVRSALVLKLLTYEPTGGIVATATTSLPEAVGGVRNWDYRYTWLRDAALTVSVLFRAGHLEHAERFMDWVCATAQACRSDLQVVYSLTGERELPERELAYLDGYRHSRPVRVGNAAAGQRQLDVYGEVLDCVDLCRRFGHNRASPMWQEFQLLVDWVCDHWQEPDYGIWEVRSGPRHFVHSKVMAWVAVDRGIAAAEELGLPADLKRWRAVRETIRAEVLERGWDEDVGSFVQAYGYPALDAANLRLPLVGCIAADDPKMRATIDKTLQALTRDGLVSRYLGADDGLPGGEATFAICTFWLIENLIALGRLTEARESLERILSYANDVGLFAEEIEPTTGELLGNFPQAFTHVGLMAAALDLERAEQGRARDDQLPSGVTSRGAQNQGTGVGREGLTPSAGPGR